VSARVEGPRLGIGEQEAATIVVLVGVAVLVVRPFVDASPSTRTALFAASYLTIGLASLAVSLERERARMAPGLALLLGVGAVVAVASVSGSPVPLPWSAAALPLSVLAAVAEEALFRRLAYGRLERFGAAVAIVGSALLFGLVHVPAYGLAALPVDVGAGLLFGWQRWASGTWTAPAATHAFANALVVLR
jgi:membrane protease YdiL (CAAX protease family)